MQDHAAPGPLARRESMAQPTWSLAAINLLLIVSGAGLVLRKSM